ncbi:MAG: hypothetical protein KC766_22245 [Myxococcales bacterium]|nr:hypothetical protein [Myxococcales bacterium]
MNASWAFSEDLPQGVIWIALVLGLGALGLLLFELRRRERWGAGIFLTGVLAVLLLLAATLRPVRVVSRGSVVGPRVVVLVDDSRRLELKDGERSRREEALAAVEQIKQRFSDARISVLGFGEGPPRNLDPQSSEEKLGRGSASDLVETLSSLGDETGERPRAIVLLSDGRLTRPEAGTEREALELAWRGLGVPVHTVRVGEKAPRDASIRAVKTAGAAVAHQPLALTIEIGCDGGLVCGDVPITVKELRQGVEPALLASGVAQVKDGKATVELKVTLDRAGDRILEIAITPPSADSIPANNRRLLSLNVARERIRLLHVAGRPTYDVRALRMWLKSDESVDVVAFFILRTEEDDTQTQSDDELALIPFPVDELFMSLPSFDAIVLQDIDAVRYGINPHLGRLASYVESGGGLIMVGGVASFAAGGYASTAIGRVLPIELNDSGQPLDTEDFVPRYTRAGKAAPIVAGVRDLFGDDLPLMPGTNVVGAARKGSVVLWEHPSLTAGKSPMPVLALGEYGDGRTIALTVDGTHRLGFGQLASRAAGRGYGALWDGLLGWLMREPRYESARLEMVGGACVAGRPTKLKLSTLPGNPGPVTLELARLGASKAPVIERKAQLGDDGVVEIDVGTLEGGGYVARARVGDAPATRQDFACEEGGEAWADSRPDPGRMQAIAEVTGGSSVALGRIQDLPRADATRLATERHVSAWLPAWLWSLLAALGLGVHWLVRRRSGLV